MKRFILTTLAIAILLNIIGCTRTEFEKHLKKQNPFVQELLTEELTELQDFLQLNISPEEAKDIESILTESVQHYSPSDIEKNRLSFYNDGKFSYSGVLISPKGYFLTSEHAYHHNEPLDDVAKTTSGESFNIQKILIDCPVDFVLGKLDNTKPIDCYTLAFADSNTIGNQAIIYPGHLHPEDNNVVEVAVPTQFNRDGEMSGYWSQGDYDFDWSHTPPLIYHANISMMPGWSGSLVANEHGKIIGILKSSSLNSVGSRIISAPMIQDFITASVIYTNGFVDKTEQK